MTEPCYQDKCFVCGKIVVTSFLSDEDFPMHEECARELLPKLLHGALELLTSCEKLLAELDVQKQQGVGALNKAVADSIGKFVRMRREGTL